MIFFACLILLELTTLPHYIVEFISSNRRIKDFDKSCLEHIASYGSLDSLCTLYLLHHWGVTINSTALSNDCCSLLINSLELLLKEILTSIVHMSFYLMNYVIRSSLWN
jgi:hypothetical protein